MQDNHQQRASLARARRVVVKAGTRVLVSENGQPSARRIRSLVRQLAALRRSGREVVFVTSGAIGAGMQALNLPSRPTELPALQTAAAVGQHRLMHQYGRYFDEEGIPVAQVLLTHDDLQVRERHLNARNALNYMLSQGIIPIVNENDAVSVSEIRFGDNDVLASLVAILTDADALALLTTTDGLRRFLPDNRSERIAWLPDVTPATLALAGGKGSPLSSGGMASKLQSAQNAARHGVQCIIADGRRPGILHEVFSGADTGTLIGAGKAGNGVPMRKRWLGYFRRPAGTLVIDAGAVNALRVRGNSLLPIGVLRVNGTFRRGDAVDIIDESDSRVAVGIASHTSDVARSLLGKRSPEVRALLGDGYEPELVHRDNLYLFPALSP